MIGSTEIPVAFIPSSQIFTINTYFLCESTLNLWDQRKFVDISAKESMSARKTGWPVTGSSYWSPSKNVLSFFAYEEIEEDCQKAKSYCSFLSKLLLKSRPFYLMEKELQWD